MLRCYSFSLLCYFCFCFALCCAFACLFVCLFVVNLFCEGGGVFFVFVLYTVSDVASVSGLFILDCLYGVLPLLISNPWIFICHSQFYVLYWHSSSLLCLFVVCLERVCHTVCLRVTMMSATLGKITGYLPWALIWIGQLFVYHTCKKVRFTYK